MQIIACPNERVGHAEALVKSVFRWMTPFESLSFALIRHPNSLTSRVLRRLVGIKDIIGFDVVLDDAGAMLGTTGLYRYERDADEAAWIAWFCVHPDARGKGVGQALIEHTVAKAMASGYRRIRLYTSTDPGEAAAQQLYEKNGFAHVGSKRGLFTTTLFREKIVAG